MDPHYKYRDAVIDTLGALHLAGLFRYLSDTPFLDVRPEQRMSQGIFINRIKKGTAMGFLSGKRALIVGLASNRSIAWGVAQAMLREGAELAFSYPNDKLGERVTKMAAECDSGIVLPCDVSSDAEIENLFVELGKRWDGLDILVHSVAFAPGDQLAGDYLDCVTREGFRIAHDISSYSLAAMAKAARPMMQNTNGAILTMSYLGSERALPNYNVMGVAKASLEANVRYLSAALGPEGIRVNSVSAGPIKTLAAAGIGNFKKILDEVAHNAPLRRNVTIEQVGNAAAFLCSDLAAGITGENIYVDSGYNIVSMGVLD
jgi:enoyl-[acyl-carrier protein] reductase I